MTTVRIITIGDSVGVVLPEEVRDYLKVGEDDVLHVTKTPQGIELAAYDAQFAAHMALAEKVMHEDHDVLKEFRTDGVCGSTWLAR